MHDYTATQKRGTKLHEDKQVMINLFDFLKNCGEKKSIHLRNIMLNLCIDNDWTTLERAAIQNSYSWSESASQGASSESADKSAPFSGSKP